MKYKDFEGPVEELVRLKLKEVEAKHHVKVLHAVESGSRAWGFASPDSDYDVRFIYVRPQLDYLSLQEQRDHIDGELDETLDINGWDVSKALRHFHKSNATLFEWNNSPIVYQTTPEWENAKAITNEYFSCKSAMYHYYGMANKNYREHLLEDMVKYKKYFYVLRPLLACKWIEKKQSPPPVLFAELMDEVLEETIRPCVERLVEVKTQMIESEKGPRLDELNAYICESLTYLKEKIADMQDDRKEDWDPLNQLFLTLVGK